MKNLFWKGKLLFDNRTIDILIVLLLSILMYVWKRSGGDTQFFMILICAVLFSIFRFIRYFIGHFIYELSSICILSLLLLYEGIVGVLQLYGIIPSYNDIYRCTGSFFSPGLYGCFISTCSSIIIYCIVKKKEIFVKGSVCLRIIRIILLLSLSSVIIIPATQSRSAILSFVGCLIMTFYATDKGKRFLKQRYPVLLFLLIFVGVALFISKINSSQGRMLIYKIDFQTQLKNLDGTGLGNFAKAYGGTQMEYFSECIDINDGEITYLKNNPIERYRAGCPVYAFSDILQLGIEAGVIAAVVFLCIVTFSFCNQFRKGSALSIGILSLFLNGLFFYPLCNVIFQILLALFLANNYSENEERMGKKQLCFPFIIIAATIPFLRIAKEGYDYFSKMNEWNDKRYLYNSNDYHAYSIVCDLYNEYLSDNSTYLYEYSYSLNETGQYDKAVEMLKKGLDVCCDPAIYNLLGDIYLNQGEPEKAIAEYKRAFYIMPGRLLPLVKIAEVYDKTNQVDKLSNIIGSIDAFDTAIETKSIDELRVRVKELKLKNGIDGR